MAEQSTSQPNNQLTSVTVTVGTDEADAQVQQDVATVRLKLRKPKTDKKVNWTAGTVDNEDMNKKKSKCCCIYQKPRAPDESSSSDDDDECEHCHGHVEKKKKPTEDNESPASSEPPAQSMIAA